MLDMATAPTDDELATTRKVLAWLIADLVENNPDATMSLEVFRQAAAQVPSSMAELEGLR